MVATTWGSEDSVHGFEQEDCPAALPTDIICYLFCAVHFQIYLFCGALIRGNQGTRSMSDQRIRRISRQDQRRGPRRRQKADPKSTRPRGSQVTGPFTVVMPDARLNQSKTQEAFRHATGMRRCAIVLRRRRHGRQTVSQHLRRVPGKQSRTDPSDKGACCRCSSSQTPRQLLGSTRALPYTSVRHSHPECSWLRARRNTRKGCLPAWSPWCTLCRNTVEYSRCNANVRCCHFYCDQYCDNASTIRSQPKLLTLWTEM